VDLYVVAGLPSALNDGSLGDLFDAEGDIVLYKTAHLFFFSK